jgi:hypothetical protein
VVCSLSVADSQALTAGAAGRIRVLSLLSVIALALVGLPAYVQVIYAAVVPPEQRAALVDLYTATAGASWTTSANWMTGDPCNGAWVGIACAVVGSNFSVMYVD